MLIYVYSGTFEGFMSVIHRIYSDRRIPDMITDCETYEYGLQSEIIQIPDCTESARIICACIRKYIGQKGLDMIKTAFLYGTDKELIIFRYIRLIFRFGSKVLEFKEDERVAAFDDICRKVTGEAHKLKGFLRFKELSGGVLYARIEPDNDVTKLLLDFFASKHNAMQFIIHDVRRGIAGLYNGKEKRMERLAGSFGTELTYTDEEIMFQDMWRRYFKSVTIESRTNKRLQDQYMPRRYRRNMPETYPTYDISGQERQSPADLAE